MDLRFLGKVLQGALIGLGAVLPGISGGVLSVVFGVYRPIMELLSDPVHKWRTHLPELFPYMIGSAAGFLGVANPSSISVEGDNLTLMNDALQKAAADLNYTLRLVQ